jgi:hypothetical protein
MVKIARYSSSLAKLWVKYNGSQLIKVSTIGCDDIGDLIIAIKRILPNQLSVFDSSQITLHQSLTDPAICPGLSIADIYKSDKANSIETPLFVKAQEKSISKIEIVLSSNMADSDKHSILKDLLQMESKEKEVQSKEKEIQWQKERINELQQQKDQETLYKLHYQQLLTVRGLIELYEKNFGETLFKKNLSRLEKWKAYLQSGKENFKPFKEAGFTVDQVSNHVDMIFKSHSADIHSVKAVEGLILKAKGNLTDDQMKVVKIIVGVSPWKDLLSIE